MAEGDQQPPQAWQETAAVAWRNLVPLFVVNVLVAKRPLITKYSKRFRYKVASRWNTIVLLDEADVSKHPYSRNARTGPQRNPAGEGPLKNDSVQRTQARCSR